MRRRYALAWVGCGAWFVACVGSDPVPTETPDAAGPSSSSGSVAPDSSAADSSLAPDAAPSLHCPAGCLPPPPPGWTGPSALFEGTPDTVDPCVAPYSVQEIATFHWKEIGPATCTCSPSVTAGAGGHPALCNTPFTVYNGSTTCTGASSMTSINVDGTTDPECFGPAGATNFGTPTFNGTCSPSKTADFTQTKDAAQVSCGLQGLGACAAQPSCVQTPLPLPSPFKRLCIHHEGDVPCPSADYPGRLVAAKDVNETRQCEACKTTPPACGSTVKQYSTTACTGSTPQIVTLPITCLPLGGSVDFAAAKPVSTDCAVSGGTPSGELALKDVVTYCCHE